MVPDLLIEAIDPTVAARVAVDAKYKLYDERKLNSGDVYQGFLYAYAFGGAGGQVIPAALLLYPSSTRSSQAVRLRVRNAGRHPPMLRSLPSGLFDSEALSEVTHGIRGPVAQAIIGSGIQQGIGGSRTVAALAGAVFSVP